MGCTPDAAGNLLTTTDPLSHVTTSAYDELGRLKSVTDPLGNTSYSAYDGLGNRVKTKDPKGNVTSFGFSPNNWLISGYQLGSDAGTHYWDAYQLGQGIAGSFAGIEAEPDESTSPFFKCFRVSQGFYGENPTIDNTPWRKWCREHGAWESK